MAAALSSWHRSDREARSLWIIPFTMRWHGFNKIIFIIRKDLEKDFREIIGNRIEKIAHVEYAFGDWMRFQKGIRCRKAERNPGEPVRLS